MEWKLKLTSNNLFKACVYLTALWGTIGLLPKAFRYYYLLWLNSQMSFEKIMDPFTYLAFIVSTLPFAYYFYGTIFMIAIYLFAVWAVESYKEVKEGYRVFKNEKGKAHLFVYKYSLKWFVKFYIYSMSFIVTFLVSMTVYGLICGFLT